MNAVEAALDCGITLIDTASVCEYLILYYLLGVGNNVPSSDRNEESVGEALRKKGVARTDVFITSKLQPKDTLSEETAYQAAIDSLQRLQLDYFDL